ncbi:hypothetical protein niasHS_014408 [Heterodera schachtii]|uniref:Alpha-2-macroglobulin bait region domain-containing protein n=2 Tax=Heterodera TaxID=34509 RepID=A0ABD2IFM9_HETSC
MFVPFLHQTVFHGATVTRGTLALCAKLSLSSTRSIRSMPNDARSVADFDRESLISMPNDARSVADFDRSVNNKIGDSPISMPLPVGAARSPFEAFVQVNAGVVDAGKTRFGVECSVSSCTRNSRLVVSPFRAPFSNSVTLSTDLNTAEPGKSVRFRLSAVPDSFVGLLAVDQMPLSVGMARENADNPGVVDAGKTLFSTAEPGESVRFRLSAAPNSFVGLLAGDHGRRGMIGGGRESFGPMNYLQTRSLSTDGRDQIRAEVSTKYTELLDKWTNFAYFAVSFFAAILIGMVVGFVGLFWSMMLEFGRLRDQIVQIVAEIRK